MRISMKLEVQFNPEAAHIRMPREFVRKVEKVVEMRGAPRWITRGSVVFDIFGTKRTTTRTNIFTTHTLHCLIVKKDGRRYRYVDDNPNGGRRQVQKSGRRMVLEELV
jgi:hypothetical protein